MTMYDNGNKSFNYLGWNMATTKKTTTKKPVKKAAPKRAAAKTSVKRKPTTKHVEHKSLKLTKETEPFFSFRLNHETLYWLLLSMLVFALGLWVININDRVQRIYDDIDRANAEQSMVVPATKQ